MGAAGSRLGLQRKREPLNLVSGQISPWAKALLVKPLGEGSLRPTRE